MKVERLIQAMGNQSGKLTGHDINNIGTALARRLAGLLPDPVQVQKVAVALGLLQWFPDVDSPGNVKVEAWGAVIKHAYDKDMLVELHETVVPLLPAGQAYTEAEKIRYEVLAGMAKDTETRADARKMLTYMAKFNKASAKEAEAERAATA